MIKTNFHTHTIYCDGKDTPEELVEAAIKKDFTALGFSEHSFFDLDKPYTLDIISEEKYFNEVSALKEKYNDKIEIFCGIEQDIFSPSSKYNYDYKIGSVHSIYKNGEYLIVDGSLAELADILQKFYDNNFEEFTKDYFETVSEVIERTDADIIGHFDLVLKNQERMFYTPGQRFYAYAESAVLKLIKYDKPFEINTGAMAKGYRTLPYPDFKILKFICENGGKIIFSSDCHNKKYLDFAFYEAEKIAISAGFTEQAIITRDGIKYIPIA